MRRWLFVREITQWVGGWLGGCGVTWGRGRGHVYPQAKPLRINKLVIFIDVHVKKSILSSSITRRYNPKYKLIVTISPNDTLFTCDN